MRSNDFIKLRPGKISFSHWKNQPRRVIFGSRVQVNLRAKPQIDKYSKQKLIYHIALVPALDFEMLFETFHVIHQRKLCFHTTKLASR